MVRRAIWVAGAAGALLMFLPATPASAHAFLADSNPADGAVLASAPRVLRLGFSESIVLPATRIDIVDSAGRHYPARNIRLAGGEEAAPGEDPVELVADLPPLPRSAYRVSWQTLSSDDLHDSTGLLVFGVGQQVTAAGAAETPPRLDEWSLRWLMFSFLAMSLGGLFAVRLLRRNGVDRSGARRAARLSATGAALAAVSAMALLADQYAHSGTSLATLLHGSYGRRWALREAGFAGLLCAAATYRAPFRPAFRAVLSVGGAACACVATALLGHSGAGSGLAITRIGADAAHLAAAATWAGALLVLVLVGIPLLRKGIASAAEARAVLRSFAVPGAVCVSVIAVTGVYLASEVVGSVDAALRTTYGRTLLIKLCLVGIAGVLAVSNHRRLRHRASFGVPGRSIVAEAVTAVAVLALAALLTSGQPAREPQFVATPRPATVNQQTVAVADLQQVLSVRPNQPGRNVIVVNVFDTRRPAPAPIRRVLVTVIGLDGQRSGPLVAQRLTDGQWSVASDLAVPGRTGVEVRVQRAGLPDASHRYRWVVGGGQSLTRPALVSTAPLGTALRVLSGAIAAAILLAWAVSLLRRRRGGEPAARSDHGPREAELATMSGH